MQHRAVVSGAGIAGQVVADRLARAGWECIVLERADELRASGQNVDIRGAGRTVIERLGIAEQVANAGTGEVGTRFVDGAGRSLAEFPEDGSAAGGATAEWEILRSQLAALLHERMPPSVQYRFGTSIRGIDDEPGTPVRVQLADGSRLDADVVVIAEGAGSRTRDLLAERFGSPQRRTLGVTIGYCSIDRADSDDAWWRWYNATGGRSVTLRPDNVGRTRATLSFRSDPVGTLPDDAAKALLRDRFADAGWETDRILDQLDRVDDLYLDDISQVIAPAWTAGRVALVGDAACCPSPVSGMGTTLALVSAYVLAQQIAAGTYDRGFGQYEQVLRPYVARAQQLPPGAPGVMHPTSRIAVGALRTAFRLAGLGILKPFERKLFHPPADTFVLPS